MKNYEVYIKIGNCTPQWYPITARDQYHMKTMVAAIYGSNCTITNYKTV